MERFILVLVFALTLISCATKVPKIVEKNTEAYHRVETELQQPFSATDQAELKVMIEKDHSDFSGGKREEWIFLFCQLELFIFEVFAQSRC